jgi:hypothetical protein
LFVIDYLDSIFVATWNSWYTVYYYFDKRRILNYSFTETIRINITNLEFCDRLDSNYSLFKSRKITSDAEKEVNMRKADIAAKIKQIEKDSEVVKIASISFTWFAILIISVFFLILIINDLFKLVAFMKKHHCSLNVKIEKRMNKKILGDSKLKEKENLFKQVIEKDKYLFQHPYYQKIRKPGQ